MKHRSDQPSMHVIHLLPAAANKLPRVATPKRPERNFEVAQWVRKVIEVECSVEESWRLDVVESEAELGRLYAEFKKAMVGKRSWGSSYQYKPEREVARFVKWLFND